MEVPVYKASRVMLDFHGQESSRPQEQDFRPLAPRDGSRSGPGAWTFEPAGSRLRSRATWRLGVGRRSPHHLASPPVLERPLADLVRLGGNPAVLSAAAQCVLV